MSTIFFPTTCWEVSMIPTHLSTHQLVQITFSMLLFIWKILERKAWLILFQKCKWKQKQSLPLKEKRQFIFLSDICSDNYQALCKTFHQSRKTSICCLYSSFHFLLQTMYKQSKTFTTSEMLYVPMESSIKDLQPFRIPREQNLFALKVWRLALIGSAFFVTINTCQDNEVSTPCWNGHHQKVYKQQMLERVWRKGNLALATVLVGL